jgi:hypothetical protein
MMKKALAQQGAFLKQNIRSTLFAKLGLLCYNLGPVDLSDTNSPGDARRLCAGIAELWRPASQAGY